jgi:hypothetical protein
MVAEAALPWSGLILITTKQVIAFPHRLPDDSGIFIA